MAIPLRLLPAFLLCSLTAQAQVPNGGFENWTDNGLTDEPDDWSTVNLLSPAAPLAEQNAPAAVGSWCILLTTRNIEGLGLIPGLAISGSEASPGFPYAQRPAALAGSLKYVPAGNGDAAGITLTLTRWDNTAHEQVGVGVANLTWTTTNTGWTTFSAPIMYGDPGLPDTAMIALLSSVGEAVAGSMFYVDDLHFSGTATGIDEADGSIGALRLQPNPATDHVQLELQGNAQLRTVRLWNTDGRLVRNVRGTGQRTTLDLADLAPGVYLLEVEQQDGALRTSRFVKQ